MLKRLWIMLLLLQQLFAAEDLSTEALANGTALGTRSPVTEDRTELLGDMNNAYTKKYSETTQNFSSFYGSGNWGASEEEEFIELKVANFLQKYGGGAVLVLGVVGNAAALVVLLKKKFRANIFNCYLIAFTTADIVFVVFDLGLAHWNEVISEFVPKHENDVACKLCTYITKASYTYSNWALAGLNLNRAIAIIFPLKVKLLTNRKNNYLYLLVSFVVIFILEIYEIIGHEVVEGYYFGTLVKRCESVQNPSPSLAYFNEKVITWLYFVTSTLIPGFIILLCNCIMIFTLIRRNKRRSQIVSRTNSNDTQTKNIILTLISVSTAFVVLQAPMFYISLRFLLRGTYDYYRQSSKQAAVSKLELEASIFLLTINHSINFLLYLIGGSELRKAFLDLFCGPCKNKCLQGGRTGEFIEVPNASGDQKVMRVEPRMSFPTMSTFDIGSNPSNPSVE